MKSSRSSAHPLIVRRGSVSVRIYRITRKSGVQKGATFYQVADYSNGRRRLVSFADLDAAKTEAERLACLLARGEAYAANFRAEDRAAHARAVELLAPLGIAVEVAVGDYVESVKLLGGQRERLLEAVRFFAERNPATLPTKATREIVEELLASKKALGASTRYVQDLECRLSRFSRGKVWPESHDCFCANQASTAAAAGVKGKHNGLRHSYASYRFALIPDAGRVAAELGHSPSILHRHYRELAKREAAEAWFAIRPRGPGPTK